MVSGLEHLLSEGIVSEVLGRLKGGKEADVYAVRFGGRVVAAKVYKDRTFRSFKNDAVYREGRSVRNSRSQRAIDRKTSFGQATSEAAWKAAEADALYKLHAAEVRVPAPVLFLDGVLLMELVLDAAGDPAPRLIDASLTAAEARTAYHDMLTQLVRILACDLIHGDLSPYNVLWGTNGSTIIDFPQIVSASHNSSAESLFHRDAKNILGFFASIDPSLESRGGDAHEIWRAYVRRELTPEFVPEGRPAPRPAPPPRPAQPPLQQQSRPAQPPRPAAQPRQQQQHSRPPPQQQHSRPPQQQHSRPPQPPLPAQPPQPHSRPPQQQHSRPAQPPRPAAQPPQQHSRPAQPPRPAAQPPQPHSRPAQQQPHSRPPQQQHSRPPQQQQPSHGSSGSRNPNPHRQGPQEQPRPRSPERNGRPNGQPPQNANRSSRRAPMPEVIVQIARSPRGSEGAAREEANAPRDARTPRAHAGPRPRG